MSCITPLKTDFLRLHLNVFAETLGDVSNGERERCYQYIPIMKQK